MRKKSSGSTNSRSNGEEPAMVFQSGAEVCYGLSKREYMAAHTFAAMIANAAYGNNYPDVAREAVRATDILLANLSIY